MANSTRNTTTSDEDARKALESGDNQKIDKLLDELNVSTTASGEDQTAKPDTEGSNSSSKNLDEQNDGDGGPARDPELARTSRG
jgi:hypothetical protein